MIVMSFVFATRPQRRTRARDIPFESGVSTGPPPQQRFTVSFYLTAMLFIVFDIEIVFLYPVAVVLESVGWFAVAEFGFFIAILVLAYVYIWKKGALKWRVEESTPPALVRPRGISVRAGADEAQAAGRVRA